MKNLASPHEAPVYKVKQEVKHEDSEDDST